MEVDPRLRVSDRVMSEIEAFAAPPGSAFMTDQYMAPLATEFVGDDLRLRAATGDDVTDLLTTGGYEPEEGIDWPGDPALSARADIEWQRGQHDEPALEAGCLLWAGEVIRARGDGIPGPFYIHEQAARAWAFSTALGLPGADVFEAQVVPYACVRSLAPGLLRGGADEYRRLRRYHISPIPTWGRPAPVELPGQSGARDGRVVMRGPRRPFLAQAGGPPRQQAANHTVTKQRRPQEPHPPPANPRCSRQRNRPAGARAAP